VIDRGTTGQQDREQVADHVSVTPAK
jgi:hypothetical protein